MLERLNYLGGALPAGVEAQLGPDATGLGWVYQYYLDVDPARAPDGGYDLGELRALQDWFVRYQLNAVQGVAEVASIGGFVRQYQIEVDSQKMRALGVSLNEVMNAVSRSNLNVGGKIIEENGMEFVVRGIGLIKNVGRAWNRSCCSERKGTPIYLARRRESADRRRFPARRARTSMAAKSSAAWSSCARAKTRMTSSTA